GNSGHDFSDGDLKGLIVIGRYLAAHGITAFAPTSLSLPYESLKTAFLTAKEYLKSRPYDGARLAGIHMEGPYFSGKKKGAQNGAYLRKPDREGFRNLQEACGGLIRIVDLAPELEGAEEFIREIAPSCRISVGHTDAAYEEACHAFEIGASHVTHLFNGMAPIHHRKPGVVGAACEQDHVTAELICDGFHVHPSVIRMAFWLFPGRICLISDSLRCCGMQEGEYEFGGQVICYKDGAARLPDGNLAGAASNLYDDMVSAIRFGISPREAILAASWNPARAIGIEKEAGSLEEGKLADFLVCDGNWNLQQVYIGGMRIK
nr:N-acetylglucosamine-6-phosphate deacetylase [Lachnospiraceae bacterium]